MGSQFSMGVFAPEVVPYTAKLDVEKIRRSYGNFSRSLQKSGKRQQRMEALLDADNPNSPSESSPAPSPNKLQPNDSDGFFMSRAEFGQIFEVQSADALYKVFGLFDPLNTGRVVACDVWSAFMLSVGGRPDVKISFLFSMADQNLDGRLNEPELVMLLHSASRGFARCKNIQAPSTERVDVLAREMFEHPEVRLDDRGEMSCQDLIMLCSAIDGLRNYLSNLDATVGADVSNLYKLQTAYLKELLLIDTVLDEIVRTEREMSFDDDTYKDERGGDIQLIAYEGLFEDEADVDRLYLRNAERALDDRDDASLEAHRKAQSNLPSGQAAMLAQGSPGMAGHAASLLLPPLPPPGGEASGNGGLVDEFAIDFRSLEFQNQSVRRAKRKRLMREEDEKASGKFGDARAFRGGYKRVVAGSVSNASKGQAGGEKEDLLAAGLMEAKWGTMKNLNNDGLLTLDVDLLEDIVEATGNVILDREAELALGIKPHPPRRSGDLPPNLIAKNQLGKASLDGVITWWKERQRRRRLPKVKPWRKRLDYVKSVFDKAWGWVDGQKEDWKLQTIINSKEERWGAWKTGAQVAEDEAKSKFRTETPKTPGTAGVKSTFAPTGFASLFAQPASLSLDAAEKKKSAWGSDDEADDDEDDVGKRNAKVAARISVGHVVPSGDKVKSTIKFDIAATDVGGAAPAAQAAASMPRMQATPSSRGGTAGGARPKTAASHIRLFAATLLNDAYRSAKADWAEKHQAMYPRFNSVLWIDFPVREGASDELIHRCVDEVSRFFESVPHDYARALYAASKVEVCSLNSRDVAKYIRVTLFADRDPFEEVEKNLPGGVKPRDIVEYISGHADFNVTLDEVIALTKQFVDFEHRCYGPQEDELGDKGMDPVAYVNSVKGRRKAALKASKAVANKEMELAEIKEHLLSRGFGVKGTIGEIRERCELMFAIQAEVCGYGELSMFGEGLAHAIFKRVDRDNDGALNFNEMNALQRGLGGIALEYPRKYHEAMIESGFATTDDGWLRKEGLVAYYERFGKLPNDCKSLGIGSLDDYVTANISITGEVRAKVLSFIEKIFDSAREAHYGLKLASYIGKYTKDIYLDWECKRLSDFFLREECPKFLKEPGGPALFLRQIQQLLSNGRAGYIAEFRAGVEEFLGQGWGWSTKDEWEIVPGEEAARRAKEIEMTRVKRIADKGLAIGIRVEDFNIGTLQGWRDFTLADGSKPMWLREELESIDDEAERVRIAKDDRETTMSEVSDVPRGTIEIIANYKAELDGLILALSKPLPRRQREELQAVELERRTELKRLEGLLERGVHIASHHSLRSYDAMKSVCKGVHSINWGNRAFTMRVEAEGFDFFHHLPDGTHETSELYEQAKARAKRAAERKADAKTFIEEERRRKLLDAEAREKLRAEMQNALQKQRLEEEKELYTRGAEARVRGYLKLADQKLCIEMWRRLHLLFENRYDQNDSHREKAAVAVALNNVAVVLFEFGGGSMIAMQESTVKLRKAHDYIMDAIKELKTKARDAAVAVIKAKQAELDAVAFEKKKERLRQDQVKKGGGKPGKRLEHAIEEENAAIAAAAEARKQEREIRKLFAVDGMLSDSEDEESDDEEGTSDEELELEDDMGEDFAEEILNEGGFGDGEGSLANSSISSAEGGLENLGDAFADPILPVGGGADGGGDVAQLAPDVEGNLAHSSLTSTISTRPSAADAGPPGSRGDSRGGTPGGSLDGAGSRGNSRGGGSRGGRSEGSGDDFVVATSNRANRRRSALRTPVIASGGGGVFKIPEDIAFAALFIKFNLVTVLNEIGEPLDEEDDEERKGLKYQCFTMFRDCISFEAKLKSPVGDSARVHNLGVAAADTFPPAEFDKWGIRVTKEDIERAAREEEERLAEIKRAEERAAEREAKRKAKEEKRNAKKNKKLMREFGLLEVQAMQKEGGIDLAMLEMVNPKRATKIKDRQERMAAAAVRRKEIEDRRAMNIKAIADREAAQIERVEKERRLQLAIEDEVKERVEEDKKKRGGISGFLSGAMFLKGVDPAELRQEIVNRINAEKVAKKEQKKKDKKAEKERLRKLEMDKEKARRTSERIEAGEVVSSDESSVGSDLTDDDFGGDAKDRRHDKEEKKKKKKKKESKTKKN